MCVSVKPQGCLSVFVYCLNYFSQMLPVIQTVSVCANEYAKKTIKKTLNGHNFLLWLLFFFFFFKLSSKKNKSREQLPLYFIGYNSAHNTELSVCTLQSTTEWVFVLLCFLYD